MARRFPEPRITRSKSKNTTTTNENEKTAPTTPTKSSTSWTKSTTTTTTPLPTTSIDQQQVNQGKEMNIELNTDLMDPEFSLSGLGNEDFIPLCFSSQSNDQLNQSQSLSQGSNGGLYSSQKQDQQFYRVDSTQLMSACESSNLEWKFEEPQKVATVIKPQVIVNGQPCLADEANMDTEGSFYSDEYRSIYDDLTGSVDSPTTAQSKRMAYCSTIAMSPCSNPPPSPACPLKMRGRSDSQLSSHSMQMNISHMMMTPANSVVDSDSEYDPVNSSYEAYEEPLNSVATIEDVPLGSDREFDELLNVIGSQESFSDEAVAKLDEVLQLQQEQRRFDEEHPAPEYVTAAADSGSSQVLQEATMSTIETTSAQDYIDHFFKEMEEVSKSQQDHQAAVTLSPIVHNITVVLAPEAPTIVAVSSPSPVAAEKKRAKAPANKPSAAAQPRPKQGRGRPPKRKAVHIEDDDDGDFDGRVDKKRANARAAAKYRANKRQVEKVALDELEVVMKENEAALDKYQAAVQKRDLMLELVTEMRSSATNPNLTIVMPSWIDTWYAKRKSS